MLREPSPRVVRERLDLARAVDDLRHAVEPVVFALDRAFGLAVLRRDDRLQQSVVVAHEVGELTRRRRARGDPARVPGELYLVPVLVQHRREPPRAVVAIGHLRSVREDLLRHAPERVALVLLRPAVLVSVRDGPPRAVIFHLNGLRQLVARAPVHPRHLPGGRVRACRHDPVGRRRLDGTVPFVVLERRRPSERIRDRGGATPLRVRDFRLAPAVR